MPGQGWPRYAPGGAIAEGQGWPHADLEAAVDGRITAILDTAPIAYWPLRDDFAEVAGAGAPDLTTFGAPTFEGGAVRLDGASRMAAEGFNPFATPSVVTFCIYMARDGVGGYQSFLGSYLSSFDFYFITGNSQFAINNPPGSQIIWAASLPEDWIDIAVVGPTFIEMNETDNRVRMWLGETSLLDAMPSFTLDLSTATEPDFAIGDDVGVNNTGATSYFPGLISDVAIWDRVLTAPERAAIAATTLP